MSADSDGSSYGSSDDEEESDDPPQEVAPSTPVKAARSVFSSPSTSTLGLPPVTPKSVSKVPQPDTFSREWFESLDLTGNSNKNFLELAKGKRHYCTENLGQTLHYSNDVAKSWIPITPEMQAKYARNVAAGQANGWLPDIPIYFW